jgi:hypothetical protein
MVDLLAHCPLSGVHFICVKFRKLDPLPQSGRGNRGDPTHMGVLQRDSPWIKTSCWKNEADAIIVNITKLDCETGFGRNSFGSSPVTSIIMLFINLFVVYLLRFK